MLSALLLSACGDSSSQSTAPVTLNITDAPVDEADAVVVEFSSVTLRSDGNEDLIFEFNPPKSIDLLALQGLSSQSLIENEVIPAGKYNQIRLAVNAEFDDVLDSYITINGSDYELRVPGGSQSGLKINTPFTVVAASTGSSVADENAVYTIDFDLRKSVVNPIGQPGYFLKPVLRMVQNTNTGSVSGSVDPGLLMGDNCSDSDPLTGNAVYVFEGAVIPDDFDGIGVEPVTTSLVNFDEESGVYSYEVGYLAEGEFTLGFTCAADLDDENDNADVIFDVVDNITIVAGENLDHPID
ncbi:MAG: DUF4382 domain-containing protein [Pseudomonadota bacterium]